MNGIKIYTGPGDFLEASASFLEEKEMQHNVILGNCYNILLENRTHEHCCFINSILENNIRASSVKVSPKIVLASQDKTGVEEIFAAYQTRGIDYSGVIGNPFASELFASLASRRIVQQRLTQIQGLDKVNDLHLAAGSFEPARLSDLPLLKKWCRMFFDEEQLLPKKNNTETEAFIKNLMLHGNLFSWIHQGKAVSMAAIIRKTKHTAIIGLVYTPEEYRGKGFGKSCVHQLSQYILKMGYRESGLLVYETNSVAKTIYAQIGYTTVSELMDIDFE